MRPPRWADALAARGPDDDDVVPIGEPDDGDYDDDDVEDDDDEEDDEDPLVVGRARWFCRGLLSGALVSGSDPDEAGVRPLAPDETPRVAPLRVL